MFIAKKLLHIIWINMDVSRVATVNPCLSESDYESDSSHDTYVPDSSDSE